MKQKKEKEREQLADEKNDENATTINDPDADLEGLKIC